MATLALVVSDDWPEVYEALRLELVGAFGDTAARFDHIGSTSVPALLAKPIVDVLVTLGPDGLRPGVVPAMRGLGYDYRGEFGVAGREYFSRADAHVHAFRAGEGQWRAHLLFRDFLRADGEARGAYARFKSETATAVAWDRARYQDAKERFVTQLVETAEAWAVSSGWVPPNLDEHR